MGDTGLYLQPTQKLNENTTDYNLLLHLFIDPSSLFSLYKSIKTEYKKDNSRYRSGNLNIVSQ